MSTSRNLYGESGCYYLVVRGRRRTEDRRIIGRDVWEYIILNIPLLYSLYKRNFVTGDLLYGKHLGDNLNLINTTKTISGMATVLSYCNLYIFIYFIEKYPILYNVVKFPEYDIGYGYNFLGIIKFIFLITFGIIANSFKKIFCIKINDFGNSWKYLC